MASQPNHFCAALKDNPEAASEIGLFMSDYAKLEWMLFNIFAMLSRLRPDETFSAFFSQRSIDRKTELLEQELWRLSPQLEKALRKLIRRMKAAARRRTEIAHAYIMPGKHGPMRLLIYGHEVRLRPFDAQFIKQTIRQFHDLAEDILTLEIHILGRFPEFLKARLEQVYAPIDQQLQRTRDSQDQTAPLATNDLTESHKRLGIDPYAEHSVILSIELTNVKIETRRATDPSQ